MAAKKKAAKAGSGAYAAGKAVRSNPYVQRLIEDQELRESLRNAFASAKKAYGRMNGKAPGKVLDGTKRKKRRKGRLLLLALVGGGLALALSEDLRKKALDALFGAEEEFEYTSSTTPDSAASPSEPVGST